MLKINKEQEDWLRKNFRLTLNDFPTDFMEEKNLIDYLLGLFDFRGMEYHYSESQSLSFIEDCYLSILANESNKQPFTEILNLFEFLIIASREKDYYELLANLTEMMDCILKAVEMINDLYFYDCIIELGFNEKDGDFYI